MGDAEGGEEIRAVAEDFGGGLAGIELAEGAGDGFDDEGIRVADEMAFAVFKLGDEPEFGQAAGDDVVGGAELGRDRRRIFGAGDEQGQAVLAAFEGGEFGDEVGLLFRKGHDMEAVRNLTAKPMVGNRHECTPMGTEKNRRAGAGFGFGNFTE